MLMFDSIFLLAGFARRFWPERPRWVKGTMRSGATINSASSCLCCKTKLCCLCLQGVTGDPGVAGMMGSPGKQVSSKQNHKIKAEATDVSSFSSSL